MVVLRFANEEVRRACSDPARMRQRWGNATARLVSRRLQQLEAMEAITDLAFLPFNSHQRGDGMIEVVVNDQMVLVVEFDGDPDPGAHGVRTILVNAVRVHSVVARAS